MRRRAFKIISRRGLEWLECARLSRLPWLLHAFSTRRGGVRKAPSAGLNLSFTEFDRRERVEENRRVFFERIGAARFELASLRQIHSAQIYQVVLTPSGMPEYRPTALASPASCTDCPPPGDALLSDQPGILLSIRTADCMPILLVDPGHRAVAAVHTGWRGALGRIVEKSVGEMCRVFATRPGDLLVAIGPSIRVCCYEVGEEIREKFSGRFRKAEHFFQDLRDATNSITRRYPRLFMTPKPPGHAPESISTIRLDLIAVARDQLESAGVPSSHIEVAEFCTSCRTDLFFSHRKEGSRTGRMMAVIGVRPQK